MSAKKTSSRTSKRGKPAADEAAELLKLVRAGVRRFILYDAPIAEFRKAVRVITKKGSISSHPLSAVEFRRIVKEAVRQRKRTLARRRQRGKEQLSGEEKST